jgi:SPP1 family predicted phage head-tail adaptor
MYNDRIKLLSSVNATDSYGDTVQVLTTREVFAEVKSVGMKEKYEALAVGLNPEIKFVLADYYDYGDEELLEWNGKTYKILRTYRDGIRIELIATDTAVLTTATITTV